MNIVQFVIIHTQPYAASRCINTLWSIQNLVVQSYFVFLCVQSFDHKLMVYRWIIDELRKCIFITIELTNFIYVRVYNTLHIKSSLSLSQLSHQLQFSHEYFTLLCCCCFLLLGVNLCAFLKHNIHISWLNINENCFRIYFWKFCFK